MTLPSQKIVAISLDKDALEIMLDLGMELSGIIDPAPFDEYKGIPNLGKDEDWEMIRTTLGGNPKIVMLLDPPALKSRLLETYGRECLMGVAAKDAKISASARIGKGCVLQSGVRILPDVVVGFCCKFNMDVTVHHDCTIGDFCTLAPGCRLLGNVTLAEGVFVGAGAIVLPGLSIGKNAVIGAGAVVTKNIMAHQTIVGVPGYPLK